MTINKEKLISLLVEKTGLEQEKVEEQLSELIQRIQNAAEEGKTYEIEGFGTFSVEDDDLQFTPSETLETEINNKYAGMKPIELIGAFKEPEEGEVPAPADEEQAGKDVWAFDEEEVSAEETKFEEEDAESEEDDLSKVFALDESETEASETEFDEGSGEEPEEEEFVEKDESEEEKTEPEPQDKGQKVAASSESEEEQDAIGKVLLAAVVVIVLGVGGWLTYDMVLNSGGSTSSSSSSTSISQQSAQMAAQQTSDTHNESSQSADEVQESAGETSEPEQDKQVTKQGEPRETTEQAQQNTYGLRGEVNTSLDGYTIVVYSQNNQKRAESNKSKLEEEGYRVLINEADVDGTMYYRVGIGQFPTIQAAQKATDQLPEPYKSNNFIRRIQS